MRPLMQSLQDKRRRTNYIVEVFSRVFLFCLLEFWQIAFRHDIYSICNLVCKNYIFFEQTKKQKISFVQNNIVFVGHITLRWKNTPLWKTKQKKKRFGIINRSETKIYTCKYKIFVVQCVHNGNNLFVFFMFGCNCVRQYQLLRQLRSWQ